jgi:hypothetical protein
MDASVYSEAKGEYTKQLTLFIVPAFHRFFMGCLQQAAQEEPLAKRQLWKFQEILSQIPEWNMDKVQREVQKLISEIQCDYLEELLTAVFIAHTKVLTAIRVGNKNKRVQITIPKLDHFIHRALSESSRFLWSSAYLFHSELSPIEKQKNHRQIEQILHDGVAQAIRGLLPVKNILKDYLAEPEADTDAEDEDEHEHEHEHEPEVSAIPKPVVEEPKPEPEPIIKEVISEEAKPVEPAMIDTPDASATPAPTEPAASSLIPDESALHKEIQMEQIDVEPEPKAVPEAVPEAPQQPPTFIVETEPSVQFTNFDQVIQKRGEMTHIDYVEKNRDADEAETDFGILEDADDESLSDFEDLDSADLESLKSDDYDTLP